MKDMTIRLGMIKDEVLSELRNMGIVEIRTVGKRTDIIKAKKVDGSEIKIRFRKVSILNKRGKPVDVKITWEVVS